MMGMFEVVTICGALPALWLWLLCNPTRAPQQVQAQAQERDWRDDLDWRQ